jgi:hypothetical protein
MSLKDIWKNKVNDEDYVIADDINNIAQALIAIEEQLERGGTVIWHTYTSIKGLTELNVSALEEINGAVVKSGDYVFDGHGHYARVLGTVGSSDAPYMANLDVVYSLGETSSVEIYDGSVTIS